MTTIEHDKHRAKGAQVGALHWLSGGVVQFKVLDRLSGLEGMPDNPALLSLLVGASIVGIT